MATRMVRKQLYISQDQEERLKQRALQEACSEAEIVRACLDLGLATATPGAPLTKEEAWEREATYIRSRLSQQLTQRKRTGTREDIYEERVSRLSCRH